MTKSRLRAAALRLLPWLVALALLAFTLSAISLQDAWAYLQRLDALAIAILVAANALVLLTFTGRWWLILRAQGYRIPYLALSGYRLGAFGVSYFTPGPHFGGEPMQVYLPEKHHGVPRSTSIAAVALDKSLELVVNFAFLAGGVAIFLHLDLVPQAIGERALAASMALLALPALLLLTIAFGRHPLSAPLQSIAGWGKSPSATGDGEVWRRRLASLAQHLRASEGDIALFFRRHPTSLLLALLVSLVSWMAMIGEYWLALRLLGLTLTPMEALVALVAGRMALLAAMPAGLGALEASQVLVLGALGVNPAAGLSLSLLIRARDLLLAAIGLWWGVRQWRRPGQALAIPGELSQPAYPGGEAGSTPGVT